MTADRIADSETAIIIVDHGSRRPASNQMLEEATRIYAAQAPCAIVEPAHMELAQPDIATAFRRCVSRGARRVIVFPYFLSPGRHWKDDIPRLTADAAQAFPEIEWLVTAPFGLHPGMSAIINHRIEHCLRVAQSTAAATDCDACGDGAQCELRRG